MITSASRCPVRRGRPVQVDGLGWVKADIMLGSGWECGVGLPLLEAASDECLRRNAGMEIGI